MPLINHWSNTEMRVVIQFLNARLGSLKTYNKRKSVKILFNNNFT